MLEAEIKKLTAAVEALTAALQAQDKPQQAPHREPMPAITPEDIEQESPQMVEIDAPSNMAQIDKPVTRDDLRDICLSLVRTDKANKAKVSAAVQSCGGKLLKDVPDDKLADLKIKLEAI